MDDQRLENLTILKKLSPAQRSTLLKNGKRALVPKGTVLETYDERNWFAQLVDGQIKYYPAEGKAYTFDDTEQRALDPIFSEVRGKDSAKFTKDSLVLRIDRKQVEQAAQSTEPQVAVHDVEISEVGATVLRSLFEDFHTGGINVPAMPAVAVRVRSLVESDDASVQQVAELIEQDPALAGKLIAAANSAHVRGRTEICSVDDALVRMGMARACSVVITLAVQQMFTFRSKTLYAVGSEVWATATQVAATCKVLAQHVSGVNIDVEKAFLIGLLHNVGAVAVLAYLEDRHEELTTPAIHQTLNNLRAVSTTLVLNKWHMDDDFLVAGEDAEEVETRANPYYPLLQMAISQVNVASGESPLTDIRQLPGLTMLGEHAQIDDKGRLLLLQNHPELQSMPDTPGVEHAA